MRRTPALEFDSHEFVFVVLSQLMSRQERKQRRQHLRQIEEKLNVEKLPDDFNQPARRLPDEDERRALVERKIQEAMAKGAFDNLPGHGKPLNLNQNPYVDPALDLAFGLLKNNGLAPEWIERDKGIRRERDALRRQLRRAWQAYQAEPNNQKTVWQAAVARFEAQLHKLNRKIDDFNLIVPVLSCQRLRLRLEDELRLAQET